MQRLRRMQCAFASLARSEAAQAGETMLRLSHIDFSYQSGAMASRRCDARVLSDASVEVAPGEHVVLLGKNGSGKSTLARLANGSLVPLAGTVEVDGKRSAEGARRTFFAEVGYVQQDPRAQLVTSVVWDEVAFGPRNLRLAEAEVASRVERALALCALGSKARRGVHELSGGQQQRLALAGVLAMEPRYLVLDEVSAHLDTVARGRIASIVDECCEMGRGVLEITHLAEDALRADRVLVMSNGCVAWEGAPAELLVDADALALSGLRGTSLDALVLLARFGYSFDSLDVARMAGFTRERGIADEVGALLAHGLDVASREGCVDAGASRGDVRCDEGSEDGGGSLVLESVTVTYGRGRGGVVALDGVSLRAPAGEVTLVAGPSGAGKTTAALVAAGVMSPDGAPGRLGDSPIRPSDVGLVLQRPSDQLFCDTVLADVSYGPMNRGLAAPDAEEVARKALLELGVDESVYDRSPFDLSGGQRRRVALAGIVALSPRAYVFDEPAAGLDGDGRERLRSAIRRLARGGAAVVVVTHNPDEWLGLATRLVFVRNGRLGKVVDLARERPTREHFDSAGLVPPLALQLLEALDA